jgi:rare lipoprotein A
LAHGAIALTLATFLVSVAVNNSHAAANRFAEFPTPASFSLGQPNHISDSPASFNDRFAGLQATLDRYMRVNPIDLVPLAPLTTAVLPRHEKLASLPGRQKIVAASAAVIGIASMYDPTDPTDLDAGGLELASGERYDRNAWAAAIRTSLRAKFGGVRFGKNYQPAFALVQANDKQAIVKINDVGPLKRGRIIDLNVRVMRYFDPTLQIGLIGKVRVTPLAGQEWALGPIVDDQPVAVASRTDQKMR